MSKEKQLLNTNNITHADKPTLVMAEHPRSIRLIPVLRRYLSLQPDGVVIADQVFSFFAKIRNINHIPIRRDINRYEPNIGSIKKIVMKIIGKLTNPDPTYKHQGKDIDSKVVAAMIAGQNVFIAPSGVAKKKQWRAGIAFMIDAIKNNNSELEEFALSFVYVPDSFKKKHSFVLINSWSELLEKWDELCKLTNKDNPGLFENIPSEFWTDKPKENVKNLQSLYEHLRSESK
jgi:hypothetical protein